MSSTLSAIRRALAAKRHHALPLEGTERFAAVAAVLCESGGDTEVLLIRRTLHDGDPWSGHMAFPGGRQDPGDADLLSTAVRETREEVGLELDCGAHLIGRLDDLPAIARGQKVGMIIAPFVFAVAERPVLSPSVAEVAEVVWAPLGPMSRGEHNTTFSYVFGSKTLDLPAFDVDGRVVWGLTHRMLESLFETVDGGRPRRKDPW